MYKLGGWSVASGSTEVQFDSRGEDRRTSNSEMESSVK